MTHNLDTFMELIAARLSDESLHRMTISNRHDKHDDLLKVMVKPIVTKQGRQLSFVNRYATRDITKNHAIDEGIALLKPLFDRFDDVTLFTTTENLTMRRLGKKRRFSSTAPTLAGTPSLSQDRIKQTLVPREGNLYLRELGVLTPAFEIKAKMQDKYRQICKFVEIFDSLIRKMQDSANLRVVDMGAGKGYLTFAIYDYLTRQLQGDATVLGIESRDELVDNCNAVARRVGYERLSFQCGTIDDTDVSGADVLVALHACDTATDDAIFKGISAGAELIICAPCCHKQLRGQLRASNDLTAILKHGILCERQAEILTDGIRALLLQASGYKARVFEFIMPTHTAKNVMIVGEKLASPPDPATALQQIAAIKAGYGIEHHHLETLLGL
jgi:hypothetical protein